ncbi:MAG: response regulator transcription factor [Dehalococcoidia bacterium]
MVRALAQDARDVQHGADAVETAGRRVALVSRDAGLAGWVPAGWQAVPLSLDGGTASMEQRLGLADVVVVDARRTVCVELVRLLAERRTPVVVLTEQGASDVRERGYLDAGADAVLGVGATSRLVAARLDALVRASGRDSASDDAWVAGDLEISIERHEVRRAGVRVRLTRTEFDLISMLACRGGAVVRSRTLALQVWGGDSESAMHSVRVYVHRLREKLEATPQSPTLLVTEQDGYRLVGARPARASGGAMRVALAGADGLPEAAELRAQLQRDGVRCLDGEVAGLDSREVDAVIAFGGDALRFVRRAPGLETVPVIAVLAAWDETEAARALERGADDCTSMGAGARAVRARLDAAVRRAERGPATGGAVVRTGALVIDRAAGRVTLWGERVELTPREIEVLDVLAESAGRIVSHDELLSRVWGAGCRSEVHLVRMYVAYLRSKLEVEAGRPRYIVNEWGCGYRLALLPVRG